MVKCPSMAVCVLLVVVMWFSTIEGNCGRRCVDRCNTKHRNRKLPFSIGTCYRKCSKLAETCWFCLGPRKCLSCKPQYVRTTSLRCVFDECTLDNKGCSADAKCIKSPNAVGSFDFYCACNRGFTGNGTRCTDIDECQTNNGGCDANAICSNTAGSYSCACRRGMIGDGKKCIGNLALNRPAMQSSVLNGANASLAVDGSRLTVACSEATSNYDNWWAVDLVESSFVSAIVVYSVNEPVGVVTSGQSTLDNVKFGVSNTSPTVGQAYTLDNLCQQYLDVIYPGTYTVLSCPQDESTYRYVILLSGRGDGASLCIAQIEVYYVIPSDRALGCYADSPPLTFSGIFLDDPNLKIEMCIAVCYSLGYKFCGLNGGSYCSCGVTYDHLSTSTSCTSPCSGDANEICGGSDYVLSVYTTGVV